MAVDLARRARAWSAVISDAAVRDAAVRGDRDALLRATRSAPPPRGTGRSCWPQASTWRRWSTTMVTSVRRSPRSRSSSRAPITVEEFHTLNRCLDTAIAEAVTEHTRLTAQSGPRRKSSVSGRAAHELRDLLNGALLAFHALKRGAVAINGSTGAVLGPQLDESSRSGRSHVVGGATCRRGATTRATHA